MLFSPQMLATAALLALLSTATPHHTDVAHDEVLGAVGSRLIQPGESLVELAIDLDVGFNAISEANPGVDAYVPKPGTQIVVPTAWILPRARTPGTIVVNLSEMRLYLFPVAGGPPLTFPVGIAEDPDGTPLGSMRVIQKQANPTWYPTKATRRQEPDLPKLVPPGPDNPLGTHALRLSRPTYLIHGTDKPFGVGRKVSHGCLRLYPRDIPYLYGMVDVGTWVTIVREPVKVGLKRGRVYVEVHRDEDHPIDEHAEAVRLLNARGLLGRAEAGLVAAAVREARGIPVDVTSLAPVQLAGTERERAKARPRPTAKD